jgi:hypothetical protein
MSTERVSRLLVAPALFLAWCVAVPMPAAAQNSRVESIAGEQALKAEHLGSEGPSRLESFIELVQRSPLIASTSGFYPWLKNIYPGTGLGAGAGYMRRWAGDAHLNMAAAVSINASAYLKAQAWMPEIAGGLLTVDLDARYALAKDLLFYGLGPSSGLGDPLHYDYRPTIFGATAAFHPVHWFELSGRYERLILEADARAPGPAAGAPGLGEKLEYNVVEGEAALDWRTTPGYSTRGGFHRLSWSQYFETHDRPLGFQQLEYEGLQLVPILREQFVLAGRVLATITTVANADEVPFVLAPTLGDAETLRGFKTRRFTDRNRLLLTGEYRWRPSRFLDMAVFYDAGKVGARREDLGFSSLETDWGLGARFHGPAFVFLRMEIAKSREGWTAFLSGESAL